MLQPHHRFCPKIGSQKAPFTPPWLCTVVVTMFTEVVVTVCIEVNSLVMGTVAFVVHGSKYRGCFFPRSTPFGLPPIRAAGIARLPRSLLDPELFPHTAYVKILATLARKTVN